MPHRHPPRPAAGALLPAAAVAAAIASPAAARRLAGRPARARVAGILPERARMNAEHFGGATGGLAAAAPVPARATARPLAAPGR
jgi:hypothetical protein